MFIHLTLINEPGKAYEPILIRVRDIETVRGKMGGSPGTVVRCYSGQEHVVVEGAAAVHALIRNSLPTAMRRGAKRAQ